MLPGLVGGVSVSPVTGETVKDRSDDGAAGTSVFGVNGFLVSGLTHPVRHTSNPVNAQALEHLARSVRMESFMRSASPDF